MGTDRSLSLKSSEGLLGTLEIQPFRFSQLILGIPKAPQSVLL